MMSCLFILILLFFTFNHGRVAMAEDVNKNRYPEWIAEQLSLLKEGVSLGQWKQMRPNEPIMLFSFSDAGAPIASNWCARAESRIDIGSGIVAIRYAYFYAPNAPESLELPAESGAHGLVDKYCSLGLIWTERREQVTEIGQELARSVRAAIDRRNGQGQAGVKMNFWGSAFWSETGRWQVNSGTIASAYADWKYDRNKSKVQAFAFLPISLLFVDKSPPRRHYIYDESKSPKARAQEMIFQSGITGNEKKLMLDAISDAEASSNEKSLEKRNISKLKVIEALKQWMAAAQALDARHKAAVLLAADQLLAMANYSVAIGNPETGKLARRQLNQLGAEFKYSEPGAYYVYTNSWRHQAHKLDAGGPAGELAIRMHMQDRFDRGYCAGKDKFLKMIEEGELYLKQKHDLANTIAVKLMVADAYRDIVALAKGQDANVNAVEYLSLEIEARDKAIIHYRNALATANFTETTKRAWDDAWRLIAGVTPHYNYCWGD